MKVEYKLYGAGHVTFNFIPETEDEQVDICNIANAINERQHSIYFKGFKYMDKSIPFSIQPMGRTD